MELLQGMSATMVLTLMLGTSRIAACSPALCLGQQLDAIACVERLKAAQALERRNINIKRFDEIPMADAEMVFPDKKIFLKPLLIIQLLIAIIGGIVATFAALLSVGHLCPPHHNTTVATLPSTAACAVAPLATSREDE